MTDQPTNPNEFILIAAYKQLAHTKHIASLSSFAAACKKARLHKTLIDGDFSVELTSASTTACLMASGQLLMDVTRSTVAVVDSKMLMAALKARESRGDVNDGKIDIESQMWNNLEYSGTSHLMVAWRDMLVHLFIGCHMAFVKAGQVVFDTGRANTPGEYQAMLNETSSLSMFGRGAVVWKDYLFYASKDGNKLISVNLEQILDEKQFNQTEHSIDCYALGLNNSQLVCVSSSGNATLINLQKQKIQKLDQIAIKTSICGEKNDEYQAVGVSDTTIIVGCSFKGTATANTQRLTMLSNKSFKVLSSLVIIPVELNNLFIHSILFITKKRHEFAIVLNFYSHAHLVAVRGKKIQNVASNVIICSDFLNSACKCMESILVTGQELNRRFFKLDVVF